MATLFDYKANAEKPTEGYCLWVGYPQGSWDNKTHATRLLIA